MSKSFTLFLIPLRVSQSSSVKLSGIANACQIQVQDTLKVSYT